MFIGVIISYFIIVFVLLGNFFLDLKVYCLIYRYLICNIYIKEGSFCRYSDFGVNVFLSVVL